MAWAQGSTKPLSHPDALLGPFLKRLADHRTVLWLPGRDSATSWPQQQTFPCESSGNS